MKQICAWCNQYLGRIDSRPDRRNEITHGICKNCRDNVSFQMGVDLRRYLNSLKEPVVMVSYEGEVVTGNDKASTLFQKGLPEIKGLNGGEVFECAYARLPEGCGNTVHCSGCTIRRTVMKTYETGQSFYRIPATLHRKRSNDPEDYNLVISTEKLADMVLLRIDSIESSTSI